MSDLLKNKFYVHFSQHKGRYAGQSQEKLYTKLRFRLDYSAGYDEAVAEQVGQVAHTFVGEGMVRGKVGYRYCKFEGGQGRPMYAYYDYTIRHEGTTIAERYHRFGEILNWFDAKGWLNKSTPGLASGSFAHAIMDVAKGPEKPFALSNYIDIEIKSGSLIFSIPKKYKEMAFSVFSLGSPAHVNYFAKQAYECIERFFENVSKPEIIYVNPGQGFTSIDLACGEGVQKAKTVLCWLAKPDQAVVEQSNLGWFLRNVDSEAELAARPKVAQKK